MKPVRQMLHVPAEPRGQRVVLVIVVHRGQVTPGIVAARYFHDPRFEVDSEPFPAQKEQAQARRRMRRAQSRTKPRGREEERNKSRFKQHAVRLVAGKLLRSSDKGKKAHEAEEESGARPEVQNDRG